MKSLSLWALGLSAFFLSACTDVNPEIALMKQRPSIYPLPQPVMPQPGVIDSATSSNKTMSQNGYSLSIRVSKMENDKTVISQDGYRLILNPIGH